ncbi:MAG TPA: hypothetical protein VF814_12185 [Casimicrobiaceae bacterium]
MRLAHGIIVAGKVVLDEPSFADGTDVYVLSRDGGGPARLTPAELAELEAGIAEADRGETISGEDLFERLRRHE